MTYTAISTASASDNLVPEIAARDEGGIVTIDLALQLMGEMLLTALFISAPVLVPVMAVGLVISLLQVITQVQEISLTFVPKIITAFVAVVVFGPWMLRKLLAFAATAISRAGS